MSLPNNIREAIGPRERFFRNAHLYALAHVRCMVVPCDRCGALAGQYCFDSRPRIPREGRSPMGVHIARAAAMRAWKRDHAEEFVRLTDEAFRIIIRQRTLHVNITCVKVRTDQEKR